MMVGNIDFFEFLSILLLSFCSFNVVAVLIFWINVAVLFVGVGSLRGLDDVLVK